MHLRCSHYFLPLSLAVITTSITANSLKAQTFDIAQALSSTPPSVPPQDLNQRSPSPIPSPQTPPLPSSPPEDLLQIPPSLLEGLPNIGTGNITVEKFEFTGNTLFSSEELAQAIKLCISSQSPAEIQIGIAEEIDNNCPESSTKISLSSVANQLFSLIELEQITREVAKLYAQQGYSTSGAIIEVSKELQAEAKVVTIKVIEGKLQQEGIQVRSDGSGRLNANYVRSRLGIRESEPLNVNDLKEALLLLSLDPLIDNVSATLADGSEPGENQLEVKYQEANSFNPQFSINNGRSPSVGTIQGQAVLTEANLLGIGDSLSIGYSKSEGSDNWNATYTLPINSHNGTLGFTYSGSESGVIEPPFEDVNKDGSTPDIESTSNSYELTLRQPIIRKIRGLNSEEPGQLVTFEEFAVGLTASWRESQSFLLGIPFPLSSGADEDGSTRIFALRFFQDWNQQNSREVLAFRSQLNLGLNAFNSTINESIAQVNEFVPDSRFISWQGQGQWVRFLAEDTLFLVRGNVQLADRGLLSTEQFALGGLGSVRGYRQDTLVSDNGIFASAELQLPILRAFQNKGVLQVVPFIDFGTGWNTGESAPEPNTLAAVGIGLQWQLGNKFTARLDWGLPLISVDSRKNTWQENGVHFSVQYNPF
ncbi:MAG: ShlB/FhaC/HecB family hemolysin secretion/activation protein [Symploca sp. SIO2C1]|nr:ShlB/FhaC/HecB family hemolysin secretion/activation protein [Symploca sp. SIO2C1]